MARIEFFEMIDLDGDCPGSEIVFVDCTTGKVYNNDDDDQYADLIYSVDPERHIWKERGFLVVQIGSKYFVEFKGKKGVEVFFPIN